MQTPAPKSCDPAEELHASGDDDHQAGGGEKAVAHLRQAGGEHMVHPNAEADEASGDGGENKAQIPKHLSTRECSDDGGYNSGSGNEDDVNLRMSEEPEKVLIEQGV